MNMNFQLTNQFKTYKDTIQSLSRPLKESEHMVVYLLAVFDVDIPTYYFLHKEAVEKLFTVSLDQHVIDFFFKEKNTNLENQKQSFKFVKRFLDVTSNMTSALTRFFLDYLLAILTTKYVVPKLQVFKILIHEETFQLLQLPEGQQVLSNMTEIDFSQLFKTCHLETTDSVPSFVPLELSLDKFRMQFDIYQSILSIKIYYYFNDIWGFKKKEESFVNPNQYELNFYKFLHNAFTFINNVNNLGINNLTVQWEFVGKAEDARLLHDELGMGDIIDIGGITRDFVTSMTPRLFELMMRDYPIAYMLVGDLLIMKIQNNPKFTIPLFDDAGSYMYLLCGDAEACKCDLLVDYKFNAFNNDTCDQMIDKGYMVDEMYGKEKTLRSYLKVSMETNLKDFALTIISKLTPEFKRDQSGFHLSDDDSSYKYINRGDLSIIGDNLEHLNNIFDGNFSAVAVYVTLGLFKESNLDLYMYMYRSDDGVIDRIQIDKFDVTNEKEKDFVKLIKTNVSKTFMEFVQGNSDVTSDSIMEILSVERNDVILHNDKYTIATEFLFEKMLQLMTEEELKTVLKFATGMDTIPVFPEFRLKLVSLDVPTTWKSHTCFYTIDMNDKFKELANQFAEKLLKKNTPRPRLPRKSAPAVGGFPTPESVYYNDQYDFPSKVREEKERLIAHILSSGSSSQAYACDSSDPMIVSSESSTPIRGRTRRRDDYDNDGSEESADHEMSDDVPIDSSTTPDRRIATPSSPPRMRRRVNHHVSLSRNESDIISSLLGHYAFR